MKSIKEIAKEANVSVSTVSRVLNHHPYVSDEVRDHVQSIIDKYDYVPNRNAVKLSKGKTNIIGVVVPTVNHICYDEILQGVLERAQQEGYKIMILCSNYLVDKELEFLEMMKQKEVDALIFVSKVCSDDILTTYSKFGSIANCKRTVVDGVSNVYPMRKESYEEVLQSMIDFKAVKNIIVTEKTAEVSQSTKEKTEVFAALENTSFVHGDLKGFDFDSLFRENSRVAIYVDLDETASYILEKASANHFDLNQLFIICEGNTSLSKLLKINSIDYQLLEVGRLLFDSLFQKSIYNHPVAYHIQWSNNI